MRGDDQQTGHLFSYLSPEQCVPTDHPLRAVREMTDEALRTLTPAFDRLYSDTGLVVNVCATAATGTAEREAAALFAHMSIPPGGTLGADKSFDARAFVQELRTLGVTPHVAQKKYSAIDARTTRHAGYAVSQRKRKLVEQVFGWMKTVGGLRELRHRGGPLIDWIVTFNAAAYIWSGSARCRPRHEDARSARLSRGRSIDRQPVTDGRASVRHGRAHARKSRHYAFFSSLLAATG